MKTYQFGFVAVLSMILSARIPLAVQDEDPSVLWMYGGDFQQAQGEPDLPTLTVGTGSGGATADIRVLEGTADPRTWMCTKRRRTLGGGRAYDYSMRRINQTPAGNIVQFRYYRQDGTAVGADWTTVLRIIDPTANANGRVTWSMANGNQDLGAAHWGADSKTDHLDAWRVQLPAVAAAPGSAPLDVDAPNAIRIWTDVVLFQISDSMQDPILPLWHQVVRDGNLWRVRNGANAFQEKWVPKATSGVRLPRWDLANPFKEQFLLRELVMGGGPPARVTGGILIDLVTSPPYVPGVSVFSDPAASVLAAGWTIQDVALFKTYVRCTLSPGTTTTHYAFRINWGHDTLQTVGATAPASRLAYTTINAYAPLPLGSATPPEAEMTDWNGSASRPAFVIQGGLDRLATDN